MNVNYIYKQKIAEIQGRIPVSMNTKNLDNNPNKIDKNLNDTSKFNTILNNIMNKTEQSIEDFTKKYLNIPYVWGGNTTKGFDCSGFTKDVMKHFGVDINRVSKDQAKNGASVSKNDLKEGDLVFFNTKGDGISHVGIYIKDGDFIHASSAAKKIVVSNLDKGYYDKTYVTARRVLNA